MISTRYGRANNPSFPSTYDEKRPRQDLIYLDANNLYGYAMSQFLPTHGFRLLSSDEITALKLKIYVMILKMGVFMKLICIILRNYITSMMIIHFLQNHL